MSRWNCCVCELGLGPNIDWRSLNKYVWWNTSGLQNQPHIAFQTEIHLSLANVLFLRSSLRTYFLIAFCFVVVRLKHRRRHRHENVWNSGSMVREEINFLLFVIDDVVYNWKLKTLIRNEN
jgi:hypothetical protein